MKTNVEISNLEGLSKIINIVNTSKSEIPKLNEYLGEKSLNKLKEVIETRYSMSKGDIYNQYLNNNKLKINDNGFEISNDTSVATGSYPFSIALAFEFGMGIVGQKNPKEGAWEYNVNKHDKGWTYYNASIGGYKITFGYQGMELYRFAGEEIKKSILEWVMQYIKEAIK